MKSVPAGIPIKPFRAAKQRLGEVVSPSAREALSREMAHRTCLALTAAGADPLVLAADEQVEEWARGLGWEVRVEKGSDLNRAARSFVGSLPRGPWLICHADLPFIDGTVLAPVVAAVANGQSVIAPSRDGGTSLLGANMTGFPFAYGVASFHRHLAALAGRDPIVVIGPRLAVDLDDPSDLVLARRRLPWVEMLLDTLSLP